MVQTAHPLTEAIEAIDDSILPALSAALDGLLDSAGLARPGTDADRHATEIRYAAYRLGGLSELLASAAAYALEDEPPARMSA